MLESALLSGAQLISYLKILPMLKFGLSALSILTFCSSLFAQPDPTTIQSLDRLKWEPVAPGIWKSQLGEKEWAAMDYAYPPRMEALEELGDAAFPFNEEDCLGKVDVHSFPTRRSSDHRKSVV